MYFCFFCFFLQTSIERKINQMVDVVSMAHDTGLQWLDGLLTSVSCVYIEHCSKNILSYINGFVEYVLFKL